ncbi:MAG: hypothetical protein OEM96_03630 [Gemmatimonadota bacterium]|nr:hypothetical protein [Gemmatimonadota bacterium]
MILVRKAAALLALASFGGLILTLERGSYGVNPRLVVVTQALLVPLVLTMIGLALEKVWSRWLALAAAVAVLPWAVVLTFGLPGGVPLVQQTIALVASLLLLVSLPGRAMFERYEGKSRMDWTGTRMALVRWTIILNLASVLGLILFVGLYRYQIEWHIAIPAVLLAGLLAGISLLGFQKTVGLLLVAVSCVLFVPGGTYFVWKEASHTGEIYLFAASFLPGVITGWACLVAFGKPIWRTLRAG